MDPTIATVVHVILVVILALIVIWVLLILLGAAGVHTPFRWGSVADRSFASLPAFSSLHL